MKDKKLFAVTMVKNEMDVIESFVRYNLHIFDGMIILNNGSTDGTAHILKQLKDEGLPLFIIEDSDREYEQDRKTTQLLQKAVYEFQADIVVPLDADEFLIHMDKGNPREILKQVEPNSYNLVKWRTYVPDFRENEKFIPARITMARDDSIEEFYKVVIPKELIENYGVKLTFGNHEILYDTQYKHLIKRVFNQNMRIAHFPIRSKEQVISKIGTTWIYNLARNERKDGQNFHQKIIFDKLKENPDLRDEDVIEFAKKFALKSDQPVILKEDPIDLTFCKDTKIRYTIDQVKPLSTILEGSEWISQSFANYKKESKEEIRRLQNKIESISLEKQELSQNNHVTEQRLKRKIKEYENSKSWIITAPLRKIGAKLRKPFD